MLPDVSSTSAMATGATVFASVTPMRCARLDSLTMRSVACSPFTGLPWASTADATMRTFGKSDASTWVTFSFTPSSARATAGAKSPAAKIAARAAARSLDIDARHLPHGEEADEDEQPGRGRRVAKRAFEEQLDVVAADEEQRRGHRHRKQREHVRRVPLLRG